MQPWPFQPIDGMTETLEWKTDVIRTKASEQRIAVRDIPRRSFEMRHNVMDGDYFAARSMIRENETLFVPDWTQIVYANTVASGAQNVVTQDMTGYNFQATDTAIVIDRDGFENVTIDAVTGSSVTFSATSRVFNDAKYMRTIECWCPEGLKVQRKHGQDNMITVRFWTQDYRGLADGTYTLYYSDPVLPLDSFFNQTSVNESFKWPVNVFDNDTGLVEFLRDRDIPENFLELSWIADSVSSLFDLKQWIYTLKGRQKAFWIHSHKADIEPATSISSGSFSAFNTFGISMVDYMLNRHVAIIQFDGTVSLAFISGISSGIIVQGRQTVNITLDQALNINLSDIKYISELQLCRLDVDRVDITHDDFSKTVLRAIEI